MLIDPVSAAIVAVVFAAGVVAGRINRRAKGRPICACRHHYGAHDEKDGCVDQVKRSGAWFRCACLHYTGPLPITSYLTPSIFDEGHR